MGLFHHQQWGSTKIWSWSKLGRFHQTLDIGCAYVFSRYLYNMAMGIFEYITWVYSLIYLYLWIYNNCYLMRIFHASEINWFISWGMRMFEDWKRDNEDLMNIYIYIETTIYVTYMWFKQLKEIKLVVCVVCVHICKWNIMVDRMG